MKKTFFLSLFTILALGARAQVTFLTENFDISCASGTGFPSDWECHTMSSASPSGAWTCSGTDGRAGTPGMECTGDYSSAYHLDTSLLITPGLILSGYPGNIYLNFDTKTDFISGERLSALESADTAFDSVLSPVTTLAMSPVIGPGDSTGWVTHQIDLTPYKGSMFFIAFRYTSPTTYGTKWYFENVNTTPWQLGVNNTAWQKLPLSVNNATGSEIKISYSVPSGSNYTIDLYDMTGRIITKRTIEAYQGVSTYTIDGLSLPSGMYLVRMENGILSGTVKAIVP